jgi:hypothetical protein
VVTPGFAVRGLVRASARALTQRSAWRYICVVSTCSCPSHSAITVVSTSACSRPIAAVWRRTCGVIVLAAQGRALLGGAGGVLGDPGRASALRVSGLPVLVGNSGSAGEPPRSSSYVPRSAAVSSVSGVMRCVRTLPVVATCAPVPSWMSAQARPNQLWGPQSGLASRTMMAWSRRPVQSARSGASSSGSVRYPTWIVTGFTPEHQPPRLAAPERAEPDPARRRSLPARASPRSRPRSPAICRAPCASRHLFAKGGGGRGYLS